MRGGFEDLKALDANIVYEETHVSQAVFNNIINKQFADLVKPVQAKGLIKVLENAYNLDLSSWLLDYDDYLKNVTPKVSSMEKLAVESKEIQKKAFPKSWIVIPIIIVLIGFFLFSMKDNISNDINETNLSAQANETTIATLLSIPIEPNSTTQAENNLTDYNNSAVVNESNTTNLQNSTSNITFEVIPRHKLWLGIYYLDDNKSDFRDDVNQTTALNPTRPQILVMGPAFVSVKLGDTVVDSNHDGVVRYIYYPADKKIKYITKQEFENIRPPKKSQIQH